MGDMSGLMQTEDKRPQQDLSQFPRRGGPGVPPWPRIKPGVDA